MASNGLPILFVWLLVSASVTAQINLSPCSHDEYFDTTNLQCISCPTNTLPNSVPSSAESCVCANGYITTTSTTSTSGTCRSCLTIGLSASLDHSQCIACPNGLNMAIGDCTCPSTHKIVQMNSGSAAPTKVCVACGEAAHASPTDPYSCVDCPDPLMNNECDCPQNTTLQGTRCLNSAAVRALSDEFGSTATIVYFNDIHHRFSSSYSMTVLDIKGSTSSTAQFSSFVFVNHLMQSAALCQGSSPEVTSCQTLANLCVLQLYHQASTACTLFMRYYSQRPPSQTLYPDWHKFTPWLYYSADPRSVLKATSIKMQLAFQSSGNGITEPVSRLTFYLAVYSLNGTYLGLEPLTNQLQLCPQTSDYASQSTKPFFLSFGTNFENNCDFDTQVLLDNRTRETVFYDMYVLDAHDGALFPVPVRIRNFLNSGNVRTNANKDDHSDRNVVDDVLTRRFFMYDTWSGRSTLGILQVVRWASRITLDIVAQKGAHDRIYPPVLNIVYEERQVASIVAAAEAGHPYARASFITSYSHTLSSFWHTSLILLIVGMVLALLVWVYRVFAWMRRNYNPLLNGSLLAHAFVLALDTASDALFWLCFALCGYWFVFYKGQQRVTVLVPLESEAKNFIVVLSVAFAGKAVAVMAMVWKQTHADIFFIDWEKPRGGGSGSGGGGGGGGGRIATSASHTRTSSPVSVWRLFFVANEWNELQSRRCISTTLTLVMLFFLLQGAGLEYVAKSTPSTNLARGPLNTVLRFAVTTFFWLLISLVQRYIDDPIGQFVDLLSVSNVSLFILIDRCHGTFYVHGRSVHPYSDTHMMELNANLKKEEENLSPTRGLLPNSQQQIFEIYIDQPLRSHYESIYLYLLAEDAMARRMNQAATTNPANKVPVPAALPMLPPTHQSARGGGKGFVAEKLIKAHAIVNKFLSSFIDHSLADHQYHVLDPTTGGCGALNRLLRVPPDMSQSSQSIFHPATLPTLASTLFYGQEYTLLIFFTLLYSIVDVAGGGSAVAVLVTFLVHRALTVVRASLGQRNIANKTLVDNRFLL